MFLKAIWSSLFSTRNSSQSRQQRSRWRQFLSPEEISNRALGLEQVGARPDSFILLFHDQRGKSILGDQRISESALMVRLGRQVASGAMPLCWPSIHTAFIPKLSAGAMSYTRLSPIIQASRGKQRSDRSA